MNKETKIMKNLALVLISIPSFLLGQTSLELKVLKELNEYRRLNGLISLSYDSSSSSASKYHSKWMNLSGELSHEEDKDVPGFQEIITLEDRNKFFKVNMFAEIVNFCEFSNFSGPLTEDQLAKIIIQKFARSPKHDEIMKTFVREGVPVRVGIGIIKGKEFLATTINLSLD